VTAGAGTIRLILMLRQAGVTDPDVLSAMESTPRHLFLPKGGQPLPTDAALEGEEPIDDPTAGRPVMVGFMLQALRLGRRLRTLEVGTGSGYRTAAIARLCRRVYTIERSRQARRDAQQRFDELGLENVTTGTGDIGTGWPQVAPFDRIVTGSAMPDVPPALADQLTIGGILVLPIGEELERRRLVQITRMEQGFSTREFSRSQFARMMSDPADDSPNGSMEAPGC
jgi:protein-L-isoaspartate(D-aspartate) O-methyltransferase